MSFQMYFVSRFNKLWLYRIKKYHSSFKETNFFSFDFDLLLWSEVKID